MVNHFSMLGINKHVIVPIKKLSFKGVLNKDVIKNS